MQKATTIELYFVGRLSKITIILSYNSKCEIERTKGEKSSSHTNF